MWQLPLPGEPRYRGAGCANRARPDLWEAGVGNDPGPPDHTAPLARQLLEKAPAKSF